MTFAIDRIEGLCTRIHPTFNNYSNKIVSWAETVDAISNGCNSTCKCTIVKPFTSNLTAEKMTGERKYTPFLFQRPTHQILPLKCILCTTTSNYH